MRAWRLQIPGKLDSLALHEEAMPEPGRGELLLRVRAVALNYRDYAIAAGRYIHPADAGRVPCSDAAAEVVAVGADVHAWSVGERVVGSFHRRWFGGRPPFLHGPSESYGSATDGWLCEYKCVSQEAVVRMPPGVGFAEAATLPCAGTTAWTALAGPNPVRAGDTVLTLGTGGVSVFSVQIAKALGATVIATTSSSEKADRLKALGADHVIDYRRDAAWGETARRLSGQNGVDRVVEVGGAGTLGQSLRAVRWGGEVVLIGFLTDNAVPLDYLALKGSGAATRPITVGDRAALADLVRTVAATRLAPVIHERFAFDDAARAFAVQGEGRQFGKLVVELS